MNRVDTIIKSDVLVIGAGGAGCRAAIAAAEGGARTVIACKAPFGRGRMHRYCRRGIRGLHHLFRGQLDRLFQGHRLWRWT